MEQEKNKKTKKFSPESSGYSKNNKDSTSKEKRIANNSINEKDIQTAKIDKPVDLIPKQESYKYLRNLADVVSALRRMIINLGIIIIIILFAVFVIKEINKEVFYIETFEVAESLNKQGYNGRVVANKLIDKINFISREA